MSAKTAIPKGVPELRGVATGSEAKLPRLPGVGVALGLAAAGLTAAAGFAADRLNRERRVALALDETVSIDPFHDDPDETHTVLASDGVALHVEVDHARQPAAPAGSSG